MGDLSTKPRKGRLMPASMVVLAAGAALTTGVAAPHRADAATVPAGPTLLTALTTPVQQVWANPDGTRTAEISAVPQRVQKAGQWTPIDPTLELGQDGLLRPRATLTDVAISSGGAAPVVTVTRSGATMKLGWPTSLPAPAVSGPVATYVDVSPGVDLRVTALPDGVSEVLVVKTRQAAASAAVRSPKFTLAVTGGRVSTNASGGLDLRDTAGALAMQGTPATMWDSAALSTPEQAQLASDQAVTGLAAEGTAAADIVRAHIQHSRRSAVPVTVGQTSLSLTPDLAMLDDPTTQYPVVIDPAVLGKTAASWSMVTSAYPTQASYKWSSTDEGVGYSDFQSPTMKKRLLYSFPVSTIAGTKIISAQFKAKETWSAGCAAREVDLWQTGAFGSSTTWNAQPTWSTKIASQTVAHGNPACTSNGSTITPGDAIVEFNAFTAATNWAAAKSSTGYLGLHAASETDDLAWKRFTAAATLSVTYDHYPALPTSLTLVTPSGTAVGCGSASAPVVINTATYYARGKFTDPDSGDQLTATFQYWSVAGTKPGTLMSVRNVGPQAQGTITTPLWGNMNRAIYGDVYRWQAYSTDPSGMPSPTAPSTSVSCYFKIDTTAPVSPAVTVDLNGAQTAPAPDGSPVTVAAGTPLSFTFAPGGPAADTYRYSWSVNSDSPGPERLPSTGTAGASVINKSITLNASGPNTLRVWAYDAVGNPSAPTEFPFTATGTKPARWSLDQTTSPSPADASCTPTGAGPAPTSLTWSASGVTHGDDKTGGGALTLTTGSATSTGAAPITVTDAQQRPGGTITAWVHLDAASLAQAPAAPRTVVSVDGATGTAFSIGVVGDASGAPRFSAQLGPVSGTGPSVMDATTDVTSDLWYEVAATVNYEDKTLEIAVLTSDPTVGDSLGQVTSGSWDSTVNAPAMTGLERLGASRTAAGGLTDQWVGQLDEVRDFRAYFPETADHAVPADLTAWMQTAATPGAPLCS